jgi:RNA polymerase sigma factor (sigma-70 family)
VLRQIRRLAGAPAVAEASDAQLLERFVAGRDEAAFTALVRRHGPMVLGVCRRLLGNLHDAEDAFQATFLILARKAGSISSPAALAGWLHEVARRTAERARVSAAARRTHERRVPDVPQTDFLAAVAWRDLQPVLDEEVGRLPEKYRAPFVLCYLEGRTYEEAARQLGCVPGSISQRLGRARALLRQRLTRRGLALPAGVLAVALAHQAAPAALPAPLAASTVKAALDGAAGSAAKAGTLAAPVAALVDGGLRAMTQTKTRILTALALLVGLLGLGLSAVAHQAQAGRTGDAKAEARPQATGRQPDPAAKGKTVPDGETMTVSGRVLDAAGKPVAGAQVSVLGRRKSSGRAGLGVIYPEALAEGRTGADGSFRLTAPRTARTRFHETYTLARADGHGLGLQDFDADAPRPEVTVRLNPEQVLRGRLVDLQGLPAAGVTVRVSKLGGPLFKAQQVHLWFGQAPTKLSVWPGAATTDKDGRFTLRGLPRDASVTLQMDGDRFAVQSLHINPDKLEQVLLRQNRMTGGEKGSPALELKPAAPGKPLELAWSLTPAHILEGAVTYADTGKPVPQSRLVCFVGYQSFSVTSGSRKEHRAGADGRYRIAAEPGEFFILVAYPEAGTPYLLRTVHLNRPNRNAPRQVVNIKLARAVMVRGTVTEQPSGKPVAGATVEFFPRQNPPFQNELIGPVTDLKQIAVSAADGTFTLPVPAAPGHLLINGPTLDYLHAATTEQKLIEDKDGGRRYYPNALVRLDLKPQTAEHKLAVTLRRGVTVTGRLVGPDGKPASARIFYRDYIRHGYTTEPMPTLNVSDGKFELPGLDPDRPQPVFFLDAENQRAAIVELPPRKAGKDPLTVQLQPCGTAVFRPVGKDGKPVAGFRPFVEVIVTPGVTSWEALVSGRVSADFAWMVNLDRKRHENILPDKEGRVTVPTLIPGATLRLLGNVPGQGIINMNRTFTVEAGKTLDLKDLPIPLP